MEKSMYGAVRLLLEYGGDPQPVSLVEGDTPLHAALKIGLDMDKGRLMFFHICRWMQQENCLSTMLQY